MAGHHHLISQWGLQIQMRVPSLTIIEDLDIFKDAGPRYIPSGVVLMVHQLGFQGMEEAFGHCIDAPMSSRYCSVAQISQDKRIQFSYNVTFETTMDLFS